MSERTYLLARYDDRVELRSLGADFDRELKQWFVPPGLDLAPFERWLPADMRVAKVGSAVEVPRGISLSQMLARVSGVVDRAFKDAEWVRVEVVSASGRGGHVYLELAERNTEGNATAHARGIIWSSTAQVIGPKFTRATGVSLGPNIKLLVRARPSISASYGFRLLIEDIDASYTLGDLEAKRREIRERLKREGLWDRNRSLEAPWDFRCVLVLAPDGAAGLGDFMAEASMLEQLGLCVFEVAHSRFQGDGSAAEMRQALTSALQSMERERGLVPDAVAIIRGGGAVSDLAWLDDYSLARCICELDVPVFTGIGHERDSTILDEVAHTRFDTPSKVIAGIEKTIRARAQDAREAFEAIKAIASTGAASWRARVQAAEATVRQGAFRQLAVAKQSSRDLDENVREAARRQMFRAREGSDALVSQVRRLASQQVADARRLAPERMAEVRAEARQALRSGRQLSASAFNAAMDAARSQVSIQGKQLEAEVADVGREARRALNVARTGTESLMREIVGQGPEKTLRRGFAIVRDLDGSLITSASAMREGDAGATIQFYDGSVEVAKF